MLTRFRTFAVVTLPLSLALAPFAAHATPSKATDDGVAEMMAMARTLQDPASQDRMANGLSAMLSALLKLPIGQFAKAAQQIDPKVAGRIPEDATLADIASERDPRFAQKLDKQTRQGVKAMGAMAGGLAAMMPALQAAMKDMAATIEGMDLPQQ